MRFRSLLRAAFWLALMIILVLALLPAEDAPDVFSSDKVRHFLAFYGLALMAEFAFPQRPLWLIAAGLAAFGGLIETLQAIPWFGRSSEWADLAADLLGLSAALLPMAIMRLRLRLEQTEPA